MSPFETAQLDQQRQEQQQTIAHDLYLEGMADAAFGNSPKHKDSAYLDGYFIEMRSLVEAGSTTLSIRWLSDPISLAATMPRQITMSAPGRKHEKQTESN